MKSINEIHVKLPTSALICRGRRVDNDTWVEGYPLPLNRNGTLKEYIICSAFTESCGDETDLQITEWYEVIPKTVCKFTGYIFNGNKWWQGDIFIVNHWGSQVMYYIDWDDSSLEFCARCISVPGEDRPLCHFMLNELSVVGNIHDNPDMLDID